MLFKIYMERNDKRRKYSLRNIILGRVEGGAFHFIWHWPSNENRRNCSYILTTEFCIYVSEERDETAKKMTINARTESLSWIYLFKRIPGSLYSNGSIVNICHSFSGSAHWRGCLFLSPLLLPPLHLGLCRFWFKPLYSFLQVLSVMGFISATK